MKSFIVLALVLWAAVNCASLNLGRIVGGHDAEVGEAPYIVQFNNGSLFCAGSLIRSNWVVTAGHCLDQEGFKVYAGLHAEEGYDDPEVQVRTIPSAKHYIVHEYNSEALNSVDIGLLYIAEPFDVETSARVKTIPLATGKYEQSTPGKVYGWGIMDGFQFPTNLQVLDVNIVSYEQCLELFKVSAPLASHNICTESSLGTCLFDSGGPLVHNTPEGLELVGTVAWGEFPCEGRTTPSVYMNVSMLHEWITEKIDNFVLPA